VNSVRTRLLTRKLRKQKEEERERKRKGGGTQKKKRIVRRIRRKNVKERKHFCLLLYLILSRYACVRNRSRQRLHILFFFKTKQHSFGFKNGIFLSSGIFTKNV